MKTMTLFLILFAFFNLVLSSLNAQTIYVDIANNTGTEDGSQQHPYNTIKEGINAASPGVTVAIAPGTYIPDDSWSGNDKTLLLKAGVSLVGASPDNTLIDGIIVDQEVSNLSISLKNLSFDEFHFARGTVAGPFNEPNIIRNCITTYLDLPFGPGIPINDSTPGPNYGFLIENNDLGTEGIIEFKQGSGVSDITVQNNACGYIYLKCGAGYTFLIDNNDFQYGIFDKSGANHTVISNNRIYNGVISDYSGGNQNGVEDEIIEYNVIICDENSPALADEDYKGAIIAKSRSVTIRNNTITCTGNVSGIRSTAGAPLFIQDNDITLDEVQEPNPDPVDGTVGIFNYSGWGYVTGNKIYGGQTGYFSKAGTVEFANNEIDKSFLGFYSMGAEEVHHNTIENCFGDGMILDGLRGPVHNNIIKDNAGAGMRVTRVPIDLGGGVDTCPGNNIITGNGNYDLYIECQSAQHPTLHARYNVWEHTSSSDISQYDIRDASDSTGLVTVDFTPWGYLGMEEGQRRVEAGKQGGMEVFPNPLMGDVLNIRSKERVREIKIISVDGREVKTVFFNDEREVSVDISGLPGGIYLINVKMESRYSSERILIIRNVLEKI
jgi:hypothetical protein